MQKPNIFTEEVSSQIIDRVNKLSPETQALWGKMNVSKMLAHCNVTYEFLYTDKHPKPKGIKKFMLRYLVKGLVVGIKPYKKNNPTGPQFIIKEDKNFEEEKTRLVDFIQRTQKLGENHFDGLESHSFGVLDKNQWNNMFYRHLDHHLCQFGV